MTTTARLDGHHRVLAVVAVALALLGALVLVLAFRGPAGPLQPSDRPAADGAAGQAAGDGAADPAGPADPADAAEPDQRAEAATGEQTALDFGPVMPASEPVGWRSRPSG